METINEIYFHKRPIHPFEMIAAGLCENYSDSQINEIVEAAKNVNRNYSCVFLISSDKELKNLIGYYIGHTVDSDNSMYYIIQLTIRKDLRGKGIGTTIMNGLINHLKNGCNNRIELEAEPSAVKFWLKLGFYPIDGSSDIANQRMRFDL